MDRAESLLTVLGPFPRVADLFLHRGRGRLQRDVMRTSDFHGDRQWHSTGMFAERLGPPGLDQELIMPLPAPPGIARRLVFFRAPGSVFPDAERDAAVMLRPHIVEALRLHGRRRGCSPDASVSCCS